MKTMLQGGICVKTMKLGCFKNHMFAYSKSRFNILYLYYDILLRTDSKLALVSNSLWFRFPYPCKYKTLIMCYLCCFVKSWIQDFRNFHRKRLLWPLAMKKSFGIMKRCPAPGGLLSGINSINSMFLNSYLSCFFPSPVGCPYCFCSWSLW